MSHPQLTDHQQFIHDWQSNKMHGLFSFVIFSNWHQISPAYKNSKLDSYGPNNFKAPHRAAIDTKTFTPPIGKVGIVSCLCGAYLKKACPLPSICLSLTHKPVIFPNASDPPPRGMSLGIIGYLRGITNVPDRLAPPLVPRSHSVPASISLCERVARRYT